MNVEVKNGKLNWTTNEKKERRCQYLIDGNCKATTQTECGKCRFTQPTTHGEVYVLRDKVIDLDTKNNELADEIVEQANRMGAEISSLNNAILAAEVLASTHYGEY